MDAVVTAGGKAKEKLFELTGQTYKCLIEIDGVRLIDRVLAGLHGAARVDRVCLVGPPSIRDSLDLRPDDIWIDDTGHGADNFIQGVEAIRDAPQVLFSTSDLPFVTSAAYDQLIDASPAEYGVCFPVFTREEVRVRFPREASSYMPLRDGDMTGTSAFVIDPARTLRHQDAIHAIFEARKQFVKLLGLVGLSLGVRLAVTHRTRWRCLSVAQIVKRIERVAGFPVLAMRGCDPVISFDIDHERDYAECLAHLDGEVG